MKTLACSANILTRYLLLYNKTSHSVPCEDVWLLFIMKTVMKNSLRLGLVLSVSTALVSCINNCVNIVSSQELYDKCLCDIHKNTGDCGSFCWIGLQI